MLDEPIAEPHSMDWRAERGCLPKMLETVSSQPAYVPRIAEIVLFVRDLDEDQEICYHEEDHDYKIYNTAKRGFEGHPRWEAGVVTQVAAEQVTIDDLVLQGGKANPLNYADFRLEPLPDPNDPNSKNESRRYRYLSLHHTRPFVFYKELHANIPKNRWHTTVKNALMLSATFTLVEKTRFRGVWPNASVFCKAIYLGAELLLVGDVVRLISANDPSRQKVTDILQITDISLDFANLDLASDNDKDEQHHNMKVKITGKAYTVDHERSSSNNPINFDAVNDKLSDVASIYLNLYPRHGASHSAKFPFSRILGRCYEANAMLLWFPDTDVPDLSIGLSGTVNAREYARTSDKRIVKRGRQKWFWAETRTEALDLETFNGVSVGAKDNTREPRKWVKHIDIIDGMAGNQDTAKRRREFQDTSPSLRKCKHPSAMANNVVETELKAGRKRNRVDDDESHLERSKDFVILSE